MVRYCGPSVHLLGDFHPSDFHPCVHQPSVRFPTSSLTFGVISKNFSFLGQIK